jgi:hypothetical protein
LLTGIVYIAYGLLFYISPLTVIKFFAQYPSDGWMTVLQEHEFVEFMHYLLKSFSALLFSIGCAMILPLFDPLKYRGLIYFTNILFPLMASFLLTKNAIQQGLKYWELVGLKGSTDEQKGPILIIILCVSFLVIAITNGLGLKITSKKAKEGLE